MNVDEAYIKKANMAAHLVIENEKQRDCEHFAWEKVDSMDELYWRCTDCLITNSEPVDPTELKANQQHMRSWL